MYALQGYGKCLDRRADDYLGTIEHDGWITLITHESREWLVQRDSRKFDRGNPKGRRRIVRKKQARH